MDTLQISSAAARVNAGMTQDEVSKQIGVSKNTIINWESGKSEPTISQARALANLYSIPLECIIFVPKETN